MDTLPKELEISQTADGSPTICFSQGETQEKMHNSQGALSESMYIYGNGLDRVIMRGVPPRVISVGLGIGYCEIIAFALALREKKALTLWSFETFEYLAMSMRLWLVGLPIALSETYEQVLTGVSRETSVSSRKIKAQMGSALADGTWQIRREFPLDIDGIQSVNCVLFDAFSSKTSPQLWSEAMFKNVFRNLLADNCVFATYAATGALNRALDFLNFTLENRPGFGGKRESTLGLRGVYASP